MTHYPTSYSCPDFLFVYKTSLQIKIDCFMFVKVQSKHIIVYGIYLQNICLSNGVECSNFAICIKIYVLYYFSILTYTGTIPYNTCNINSLHCTLHLYQGIYRVIMLEPYFFRYKSIHSTAGEQPSMGNLNGHIKIIIVCHLHNLVLKPLRK